MARRVIRNLDAFAAQFFVYGNKTRGAQRLALAQSTQRVNAALDHAARRVGGGDKVISGVGKTGAKVGHRSREWMSPPAGVQSVVFKSVGPWQIKDSSISGGPTKAHDVSPNLRRSPRPMAPASKFMPAMKTKGGQFYSNFNRKPGGPFIKYQVDGTPRSPHWRNAIQSVQRTIIDAHQAAFDRAAYETFA